MGVSQFKAHALEIMNRVADTKEPVEITKHGKAIVHLVPAQTAEGENVPGKLAGTMKIKGDIITPLGEEIWEACSW